MKICPNCQTQNDDGAKFCAGCGRPLAAPQPQSYEPAPQQQPFAPQQPFTQQPQGFGAAQQQAFPGQGQPFPPQGQPFYPQQPGAGYPQQPYPAPAPKKKNKALLILLPLLAAVLVTGVLIGVLVLKNRPPKPTDFEVTGYIREYDYGGAAYYIVVKNNYSKTVAITGSATAKDANGGVLATNTISIYAIGAGQTSADWVYFGSVTGVASVEYELSYDAESGDEDALRDLAVDTTPRGGSIAVSVTNNGSKPARYVWAYILFFDSAGNLVDADETWLEDDDDEIKPGATLSDEFETDADYDHYEVYLSGCR